MNDGERPTTRPRTPGVSRRPKLADDVDVVGGVLDDPAEDRRVVRRLDIGRIVAEDELRQPVEVVWSHLGELGVQERNGHEGAHAP